MLSCSGDDLAIPHDSDPLGDDILPAVGGHLDVHSPAVALKVRWHLRVSIAVLDVTDFGFAGMYCPSELVDVASGFAKALVGDGGASSYCRDEAIGDGAGCVSEVVVLHAEEGLS